MYSLAASPLSWLERSFLEMFSVYSFLSFFGIEILLGHVNFRAILRSSGSVNLAKVSPELPLEDWSTLDIQIVTEDANFVVVRVDVHLELRWSLETVIPDLITLVLESLKNTCHLLLKGEFLIFVSEFLACCLVIIGSVPVLLDGRFPIRYVLSLLLLPNLVPLGIDLLLQVHELLLLLGVEVGVVEGRHELLGAG